MPTTLTIRNLDDRVKQLLKIRAAAHGRSMAAEVRDILTRAVMESRDGMPKTRAIEVGGLPKSVCDSIRGIWKGRLTTDDFMKQTRGE